MSTASSFLPASRSFFAASSAIKSQCRCFLEVRLTNRRCPWLVLPSNPRSLSRVLRLRPTVLHFFGITFLKTLWTKLWLDEMFLAHIQRCFTCKRLVQTAYRNTSWSTTTGQGGSLKNRKAIGEVACCESPMPKQRRWCIARWLMSPLFLWLSTGLPTHPSEYLSNLIWPNLSICLSIYLSIYCIYLIESNATSFVYLSIYLSTVSI